MEQSQNLYLTILWTHLEQVGIRGIRAESMAANTFESQSKTIGELLGSNTRERIVVPLFQRGYEWEAKHVTAFWRDLLRFTDGRGTTKGPERYFLGPIVTLQKPGSILELLDGQQRLATTTILLSALRDVAASIDGPAAQEFASDTQKQLIEKETGEYSLTLGETDNLYFQETIQVQRKSAASAKLRTHRNIEAARKILLDGVKARIKDCPVHAAVLFLKTLRTIIRSDLVVARITVDDERDAFQIFETLNDRGLKLAAPDLLLNYLMHKADEGERGTIRSLWNDLIEGLESLDLDNFLRHWWVSKHGDVKKTDLFTVIREDIEVLGHKPLDFVRSCSDEVDSYVAILEPSKDDLGDAYENVKSLVKELDLEPAIPLLLSLKQFVSNEELKQVAGWMLVYFTRHSILANQERSDVEDLFYELARYVRDAFKTGDQPDILKRGVLEEMRQRLEQKTPGDSQIKAESLTLSPREAKYILSRIADKMQSERGECDTRKTLNIEHIFPKNPKADEWGGADSIEEIEPYLWNVGNLTVLARKMNRKLGNRGFEHKKPEYLKSVVKMANDVAGYSVWNRDSILNRAQAMINQALEIWRFENTSRV